MATVLKTPPEELVRSVTDVYERGQTVDALRVAEAFAPLKQWTGVEACTLAARIAANTGAPRLSSRLTLRAWRIDNADPVAQVQFGLELGSRRGPLALWLAMRAWPQCRQTTPVQQAELLAVQASAAADLRDFAFGEELLNRAESLGTKQPWVHLQRAHLLERQDRVEEALDAARAAGALHPHSFYRPGVQVQAQLLQLLDRDDEAMQLLTEAGAALQNSPVAAQLFSLLAENGRWHEAEVALERYVALAPLMEPAVKKWVASQQARAAYHLGKRGEVARFLATLDDEFHNGFRQRLAATPQDPERVQRDVTFVRQHFKTCAPATLAALGRFWRMPSEHLKLAEAMCYDGTPHWQQREWAENNGWFVRDFRVTYDSALSLLGRGIPFAISTVEATFAHMQVVAGLDQTRGTLLLRDPSQPYVVEVPAEAFLKRYRPFGPQGTVFLPVTERARLDGLALPDSEIYDEHQKLWLALTKHDRPRAVTVLSAMETRFPEHELVWEARLDLATYDANHTEQTTCLDKLLELFPNNPARLLRRAGCLHGASRDEQIRFLEQACAVKNADPALFVELARALQGDARCLARARYWLRRAFRLRPVDSNVITVLADLCWQDGKMDEATELYRFAANLEGFREGLYQSWFIACRGTRRTNEALAHLQDRFVRFGRRSEQPALTLAWAWREMDQPARAREALTRARELRPDDTLLLLRSAAILGRLGETDEAQRLLNQARGKVRENDWLRAAAELAENRLEAAAALSWCREILRLEPLALDAHGGVARSLARLEGDAAALAHLKDACAQSPHHYGLKRMLVEWSRNAGPAAVETAARELLRVDSADAWGRRELAVALSNLNRGEEALREAQEAAHIEPRNTFSFSVLGHAYRGLQQVPEACAQFRRAVELSVDNGNAIHSLLELARTDKERKDELAFIERELIRQVVHGDGLLVFLDLARPLIEPEKLLTSLRQAHSERPDLWHAWSALISQLGHLGQLHEARDLAVQAAEKFPHLPRVFLDLAAVHQWRNEPDQETQAAEHAFDMNPAWPRATLAFAGALERRGKLDEARRVYERALQHSRDDAQLHACYAHLLWRQRQKEAAFTALQQALRFAPGYDWAWGLLIDWANGCGEPDRAANFARVLTRERPGEMRGWLMLARVLDNPAAMPERLAAVEKALELSACSIQAWDLKAELLANAERFEEAIQACEAGAAVCTVDVHFLHGRRAWIEARRRQFPEAVRLMRAVLAENASYVWGWDQLALWLMEQGATADATAALEQLLRLRPRDPRVHRQLGFLRLKQQDRAGAQQAFAKALQLAPTDAHSAWNIFDLQLQAGDLNGAAATLRVMETHQPGARTLAAEIFLHLRTNDRGALSKAFEKLCASPDPDAWPVEAAMDAFKRAGRSPRALKIVKRALKQPSCNPQVGAAAARLLLGQRRDYAAVGLFMKFKPGELQRRAAAPLVQGLTQLKSKMLVRWLLWRRRDVLVSDDAAWGHVGYALSSFNRMKEVAAWLSDWRTRQSVQPWMLFNLCLALRHLGRYEEANALARYVLEKWGHREGSADMRLFLAVEEALAGRISEAVQHLQRVVIREKVAHDRELLALAKALVEFQQCPAAERPQRFKIVRRHLDECFSAWRLLNVMKDVRRTFRRSGKVFVGQGGGWQARLWFSWKLNWQWLLLPLAPLAVALAVQPLAVQPLAVQPLALIAILLWWGARRRR
jgi:tetratricopeptide (TPR) repeat protein